MILPFSELGPFTEIDIRDRTNTSYAELVLRQPSFLALYVMAVKGRGYIHMPKPPYISHARLQLTKVTREICPKL